MIRFHAFGVLHPLIIQLPIYAEGAAPARSGLMREQGADIRVPVALTPPSIGQVNDCSRFADGGARA